MTTKLLFIALALVVAFSPGPDPAFAADETLSLLLPANPLEGSRLFTGKGCLRCHAIYGVGGVAGPDFGQGKIGRASCRERV